MKNTKKKNLFLLVLISTLVGIGARILSVSNSENEFLSFYSIDILILIFIAVFCAVMLFKINTSK